jgi:hypothetical protein
MVRLYCSGPDTGFISRQRCSSSDAGRRATGIRSLERVYIESSNAPDSSPFKRCDSEKPQK